MSGWVGIIAGAGRFPEMVVEGARHAGLRVLVIGLRGLADRHLARKADAFHWAGLARPGRWIRLLRRHRTTKVVLAGAVRKTAMYGRFRLLRVWPDWTAIRLWFFGIPDKRNDTILSALADEFARHEIFVEDCIRYSADHLAPEGVLTRRQPSPAHQRDLDFGWPIAKQMGHLDIGQSIAVKETEVIAVEAIEGTDRMIERAGQLCPRGGWTLIKVAKPQQDLRFDVPTVGPETIANLNKAGAGMLVIEAGKTVILERAQFVSDADAAGIVVWSVRRDLTESPKLLE
jgi:hypothetical protein